MKILIPFKDPEIRVGVNRVDSLMHIAIHFVSGERYQYGTNCMLSNTEIIFPVADLFDDDRHLGDIKIVAETPEDKELMKGSPFYLRDKETDHYLFYRWYCVNLVKGDNHERP